MNAHTTFPAIPEEAAAPPADGRTRILAALHARAASGQGGQGDATETSTPTPLILSLSKDAAPTVTDLAQALPADDTRAPQTAFVRDLQAQFLENLSLTGSVRSAASAAGVSHQTVYRARRACRTFRLGWDAAMLHARANAADVLACRAIEGTEEQVFYHGEVVATRRRYSDRLLLAHLARLDRVAEQDARANAFAEDWDGAIARFRSGEDPVPEAEPETLTTSAHAVPVEASVDGKNISPGPCNTRSMSPAAPPADPYEGIRAEPPARPRKYCCGNARWPDCYNCPNGDVLETIREDMADVRPFGAPPLAALGDPAAVEQCQIDVFHLGDEGEEWWLIGEGHHPWEADGAGGWRRAPEAGPPAD